ncbi:MAG: VanZ family protein [Herbiconiux sp.]|nr:VanZ family protein [Herbiconiux sp.]
MLIRPLAAVLLGLYSIGVALVVLWPSPVDTDSRGLLTRILRELHERGVPTFVDYSFIEFSANIAMFVPLGFLLALVLGPRLWWLAFFTGVALSVSIEFYQLMALPDRYATVRDVVANSTGGAIGTVLAAALITRLRFPRRARLPRFPGAGTPVPEIRI